MDQPVFFGVVRNTADYGYQIAGQQHHHHHVREPFSAPFGGPGYGPQLGPAYVAPWDMPFRSPEPPNPYGLPGARWDAGSLQALGQDRWRAAQAQQDYARLQGFEAAVRGAVFMEVLGMAIGYVLRAFGVRLRL